MADDLECLRCRGRMEIGYVMDRGHYGVPTEGTWVEGTPEKSFWSGLKTGDRANRRVMAHRCTRCGMLEFYAKEE